MRSLVQVQVGPLTKHQVSGLVHHADTRKYVSALLGRFSTMRAFIRTRCLGASLLLLLEAEIDDESTLEAIGKKGFQG